VIAASQQRRHRRSPVPRRIVAALAAWAAMRAAHPWLFHVPALPG
jgi:hypothetical protein